MEMKDNNIMNAVVTECENYKNKANKDQFRFTIETGMKFSGFGNAPMKQNDVVTFVFTTSGIWNNVKPGDIKTINMVESEDVLKVLGSTAEVKEEVVTSGVVASSTEDKILFGQCFNIVGNSGVQSEGLDVFKQKVKGLFKAGLELRKEVLGK